MNEWQESTYWCWHLVAPDGEILDKVMTSIGSNVWYVSSTGKEYISLQKARKAAEAALEE